MEAFLEIGEKSESAWEENCFETLLDIMGSVLKRGPMAKCT